MKFQDWWYWVGRTPWAFRWFILLILVRPALDTLFFLKDVSPFLSPLYIVGVLTPVVIIVCLLSVRMPLREASYADVPFTFWGLLLFFNATAVLSIGTSLVELAVAVKLVSPFLIYLFLRRFIRSRRDLIGLLNTFLYSSAIPFGMMLYERLVTPLDQRGIMTRGYIRYSGLYGDVMSYAIYFMGALLIAGYFFLATDGRESFKKRATRLTVVAALCTLGLVHIHHTASWGVAAAVCGLLLVHALRRRYLPAFLFLLVLSGIVLFLAGDTIQERVSTSLKSELTVLEGRASPQRAFHGRMSRWTRHVENWDDRSSLSKLIGVSITATRAETEMLSEIHNDYLRILFATGIIGLGLYLTFYVFVLLAGNRTHNDDRFLIRGGVLIMLLYSVTTVPTLYFPLLYLCLSIFAYSMTRPLRVIQPVQRATWLHARPTPV